MRKIFIGGGILVALAVTLAALVALGYVALPLWGGSDKASASSNGGSDGCCDATVHTATFSTNERIVNLADPGGHRYLRIEVVLEFPWTEQGGGNEGDDHKNAQGGIAEYLANRMPAIEHALTMMLSSRTVAEVASTEGKEALREDLKQRLGEIIGEPQIKNVYFTQFIIQ